MQAGLGTSSVGLHGQSRSVSGILSPMTADTFKEILHRKPFEPFRVVMSSGESYDIVHPEMAFVTVKALLLAIPDSTHAEGERLAFCSYLHIAHVETLRPSRAA
jgi:hypothetical protein